jgi:hypothetical protein
MTKSDILITTTVLIVFVLVGFKLFYKSEEPQNTKTIIPFEIATEKIGYETKINKDDDVEVTVTPQIISNEEWIFEVALDTHSTELTNDLTKDAVLIDQFGNEFKPLEWQGDPPAGHHRKGKLKFSPPQQSSIPFTVKIFNVGEIAERNFVWD